MMTRVLVGFIVLTALLTGAIVYTYYVRRSFIMYEGFSEQDISTVEKAVSDAVPKLDQATISHILKILKRIAGTLLQPEFFTDAIRRSQMTPMDMARDYLRSKGAVIVK